MVTFIFCTNINTGKIESRCCSMKMYELWNNFIVLEKCLRPNYKVEYRDKVNDPKKPVSLYSDHWKFYRYPQCAFFSFIIHGFMLVCEFVALWFFEGDTDAFSWVIYPKSQETKADMDVMLVKPKWHIWGAIQSWWLHNHETNHSMLHWDLWYVIVLWSVWETLGCGLFLQP